MRTGEIIGNLSEQKGINLHQLAIKAGIPYNTLYAIVKRKSTRIEHETLERIAVALGVSVSDLLGQGKEDKPARPWGLFLTEKLASVGCSIGIYEEDAYIWINFPDGTLEVTEAELEELDKSTDSFLRFKLQELIARHPGSFRKQKRRQNTADVISTPPQGTDTTHTPDGG